MRRADNAIAIYTVSALEQDRTITEAHTSWCMPLAEQVLLCVQELDFFFVMIDVILLT
jgi:hypothetical protein